MGMNSRTRARTAQRIDRAPADRVQVELHEWIAAWEAQAQKTVEVCRSTLTGAPGKRPTSRQLVELAAGWVALSWKSLLEPRPSPALGQQRVGASGVDELAGGSRLGGPTGAAAKVTDWYLSLWAASIDCWASALGCGRAEDLLFEFDEAAEMVGPGERPLPGGPMAVLAITDLVHEQNLGTIPSSHVVARVLDGCLVVSVVDLALLQPALVSGAYRGMVTLSPGFVVPLCATKVRH